MQHDEVTNSELSRSLVRIESKLDRATDDHEQRLRRVERWMWTALGVSGVGGVTGVGAFLAQTLGS
jgi:hypothetical protein